jgi:hypothetical protein
MMPQTLGEFRSITANLPDDTVLLGEFEEPLAFNEIGQLEVLPPGSYVVEGRIVVMPPAILLFGGQIVNHEYALDVRHDQWLNR